MKQNKKTTLVQTEAAPVEPKGGGVEELDKTMSGSNEDKTYATTPPSVPTFTTVAISKKQIQYAAGSYCTWATAPIVCSERGRTRAAPVAAPDPSESAHTE